MRHAQTKVAQDDDASDNFDTLLLSPVGEEEVEFVNDDDDEMIDLTEIACLGTQFGENEDLVTYDEAMRQLDVDQWLAAMRVEIEQRYKMHTWELVNLPADRKAIGWTWVYRRKYNTKGEIVKYKARLVAQGFSQKPGIDFQETYAPIMHLDSLCVLMAIGAREDMEIHSMDTVGAYLNGELQQEIYMWQPKGFDDGSGRVCKLRLALYGLKQSGREWNTVIDSYLRTKGYKPCITDPCVYRKYMEDGVMFIAMHVDDFTLFTKTLNLMNQAKSDLKVRFEITDLRPINQIVGLEVIHDCSCRTLELRQLAYNQKVLE